VVGFNSLTSADQAGPRTADAPRHARRSRAAVRHAGVLLAAAIVASIGWLSEAQPADAASCVYISTGRFNAVGDDARNLNGEYVVLRNGCSRLINIRGWKVRDRQGNTYTFGYLRMGSGSLTLHTGRGTARPGHRYWGRTRPVWDNTSTERAYLRNASGTLVSSWAPPVAPAVAPAPPPPATNAWSVAFGSRPASGPISLTNCRDVVIENKTFRDLGADVISIRLDGCTNVTIRAVDFINVAEGVYARNSTNITIVDSRYSNILGPHERDGHNRGNFVQFDGVNGGLIDHNKGKGGDTEDVVSLHQSSGVVVEDNQFEGTNWTSTSGSGIAIGDGGGSNNVARRNVLLNIGQVGVYIAGGTNNRIESNVIYGEPRLNSNVGMYVWNQSGAACSGAAVVSNRVRFWKADGTFSPWWLGDGCGTLTFSGNDFSTAIDPATLRVAL
jgi:hypothetical protein